MSIFSSGWVFSVCFPSSVSLNVVLCKFVGSLNFLFYLGRFLAVCLRGCFFHDVVCCEGLGVTQMCLLSIVALLFIARVRVVCIY